MDVGSRQVYKQAKGKFSCYEIIAGDKTSLDFIWLKDIGCHYLNLRVGGLVGSLSRMAGSATTRVTIN
jgi:hypothetical protein